VSSQIEVRRDAPGDLEVLIFVLLLIMIGAMSPGTLAFLVFLSIIAYGSWYCFRNG